MAVVTIAPAISSLTSFATGTEYTINFNWDVDVDSFTSGDITLEGATVDIFGVVHSFQLTTYRLVIITPSSGSGTVRITVQENAVDEGNDETVFSLPYAESSQTPSGTPSGTATEIAATITAVPTNTISGNFNAGVSFNVPVVDFTALSVSLASVSGNGRTMVEYGILGAGSSYNIDFTLPDGVSGSFDISITGMLTRQGGSSPEEVMSSTARVTYDNITSVTADIGEPSYENGEIRIPIEFGESILYFSKTDCEVRHISGDAVFDFEYFLNGRGENYELVFVPPPDRLGLFSVDIVEHVFKSSGIIRDDVISTPRLVPFNSIEPHFTIYESLGELHQGIWDILMGFNIPVINMGVDRVTYEGEYPSTPTLYRHPSLGEQPDPPVDPIDPNNLPTCVEGWELVPMLHNTVPSKYFLMRFNVPENRTGAFFVDLIPGFVRGVP